MVKDSFTLEIAGNEDQRLQYWEMQAGRGGIMGFYEKHGFGKILDLVLLFHDRKTEGELTTPVLRAQESTRLRQQIVLIALYGILSDIRFKYDVNLDIRNDVRVAGAAEAKDDWKVAPYHVRVKGKFFNPDQWLVKANAFT